MTSAAEILENLGIRSHTCPTQKIEVVLNTHEQRVWEHLSYEPMYLDILSERLDQSTHTILNTLLDLELKGLVRQLPGMMFVRTDIR